MAHAAMVQQLLSRSCGRSRDLRGPYLDPASTDLLMNTGEPGKLLIKANGSANGLRAPGTTVKLSGITKGDYWFIYHAIEKKYLYLNDGATRRP
jgi:hypothetical protein